MSSQVDFIPGNFFMLKEWVELVYQRRIKNRALFHEGAGADADRWIVFGFGWTDKSLLSGHR